MKTCETRASFQREQSTQVIYWEKLDVWQLFGNHTNLDSDGTRHVLWPIDAVCSGKDEHGETNFSLVAASLQRVRKCMCC